MMITDRRRMVVQVAEGLRATEFSSLMMRTRRPRTPLRCHYK